MKSINAADKGICKTSQEFMSQSGNHILEGLIPGHIHSTAIR